MVDTIQTHATDDAISTRAGFGGASGRLCCDDAFWRVRGQADSVSQPPADRCEVGAAGGGVGAGVAAEHIDRTPDAHGGDVVTVILADFRGLDTMVEITVLAVAVVGVASLLSRGRAW